MPRLFILVALLFTGCMTRVALDGRYAATISQTDVEEITRLVAGFEGGRYEFIGITAYARNTVEIVTRQVQGSVPTVRYFDAYRRRRGWHLQKRPDPPPNGERVKITGDYIPG
jgi:hypothetical protein